MIIKLSLTSFAISVQEIQPEERTGRQITFSVLFGSDFDFDENERINTSVIPGSGTESERCNNRSAVQYYLHRELTEGGALLSQGVSGTIFWCG